MLCSPLDLSFLAAALHAKLGALGTFMTPLQILITIDAKCFSHCFLIGSLYHKTPGCTSDGDFIPLMDFYRIWFNNIKYHQHTKIIMDFVLLIRTLRLHALKSIAGAESSWSPLLSLSFSSVPSRNLSCASSSCFFLKTVMVAWRELLVLLSILMVKTGWFHGIRMETERLTKMVVVCQHSTFQIS